MKMKQKLNPVQSRKSMIRTMFASLAAGGAGLFGFRNAHAADLVDAPYRTEGYAGEIVKYPDMEESDQTRPRLFSGATVHDGFVFVAGKGEHGEGDIRVHTEKVLDKIEEELHRAGTTMEHALHVNVYLHNLRDYDAMNEVYRGRFGDEPPARSTVACFSGIPGNSLVEIDCIAALP